jgi:molybdopterin adenylyltransferase
VKIAVITVSDRASRGEYDDRSGPAIIETLDRLLPGIEWEREIVPDGVQTVYDALCRHPDADWIITTGGTGPSVRDQTPEATLRYCDRTVPGLAEYLRARSLEQTPFAVFSRGVAGMHGTQYVVNVPGSVTGAVFHAALLAPLLGHGTAMARGEGH